jgi:hypothetical protein
MAILAGVFLVGAYSAVYACDRSKKAQTVRHQLEAAPAVVVRAPVENPRVVCVDTRSQKCGAAYAVVRTAKAARILGRALVTTVEAVVGTLVQAAVERTAAVV